MATDNYTALNCRLSNGRLFEANEKCLVKKSSNSSKVMWGKMNSLIRAGAVVIYLQVMGTLCTQAWLCELRHIEQRT